MRAQIAFGCASLVIAGFAVVAFGAACGDNYGEDDAEVAPKADASDDGVSLVNEGAAPDVEVNCGDVTTSAANCGRCGHDCLGGECKQGVCQPVVVTGTTDGPIVSLAVSKKDVFFLTGGLTVPGPTGKLFACAKTGCAGGPDVLAANKNTGTLASDGTVVLGSFVFADRAVFRIEATRAITTFVTWDPTAVFQIVPVGSDFYASDHSYGDAGQIRAISKIAATSDQRTLVGTYSPGDEVNPIKMAATANAIYLAASNEPRIVTCALPQCATWTTFLGTAEAYAFSMTAVADRLFWTPDRELRSCSTTGSACSAVTTELGATSNIQMITSAGGELLLANGDGGDLLVCAPSDCASSLKKVAHVDFIDTNDRLAGTNIAIDSDAYWFVRRTQQNQAYRWEVMKVAK